MKVRDIQGQKFSKLLVVEKVGTNKHGKALWKCTCDCGNEIVVDSQSLITNNTKSCGCLKLEMVRNLNKKHDLSHTHFYYVWQAMKKRCCNPNNRAYADYGGRGIKVCEEWKESFENFYRDMFESYIPGLTLERINANEGYSKDNCRWATSKEQMRNTRRNKHIIIAGIPICISDACKLTGIKLSTTYTTAARENISLNDAFGKHLKNKLQVIVQEQNQF